MSSEREQTLWKRIPSYAGRNPPSLDAMQALVRSWQQHAMLSEGQPKPASLASLAPGEVELREARQTSEQEAKDERKKLRNACRATGNKKNAAATSNEATSKSVGGSYDSCRRCEVRQDALKDGSEGQLQMGMSGLLRLIDSSPQLCMGVHVEDTSSKEYPARKSTSSKPDPDPTAQPTDSTTPDPISSTSPAPDPNKKGEKPKRSKRWLPDFTGLSLDRTTVVTLPCTFHGVSASSALMSVGTSPFAAVAVHGSPFL